MKRAIDREPAIRAVLHPLAQDGPWQFSTSGPLWNPRGLVANSPSFGDHGA